MKINKKISELRRLMLSEGISAYLVPMKNNFLDSDLRPNEKRIKFLSNFSGSAGILFIGIENNSIFVDGRYTTQAKIEVDVYNIEVNVFNFQCQIDWLKANLKDNSIIGFDPKIHSYDEVVKFRNGLKDKKITLKPLYYNLVDRISKYSPNQRIFDIAHHKKEYCGIEFKYKLDQIRSKYMKTSDIAIFCQDKEFISWLLNLRCYKKKYTPSVPAIAIITHRCCYIYLDKELTNPKLLDFGISPIKICDINLFGEHLSESMNGVKSILLDKKYISYFYFNKFLELSMQISELPNLSIHLAKKNNVEIEGMIKANIQDGSAICKLLYWIKSNIDNPNIDEVTITKKSTEVRKFNNRDYLGPSFPAIVGLNENSAIIHYSASRKTNKFIHNKGILLIDSGGQYKFGTTDITRTIAIGNPSKMMKELYTITLKAHIALANIKFNNNFSGRDLDLIAREVITKFGYNYNHGTGHGVGSVLSVHEGPQSISPMDNNKYFDEGMVFSNEPGIYLENKFGIRIENLMLLKKEKDITIEENLYFEIISFAPLDKDLIDKELLDATEIEWINQYHVRVREKIIPQIGGDTVYWINKITSEI